MSRLAGNPPRKPSFSKLATLRPGLNLELADPTVVRALLALMDMQAVMGGAASHFGGPSAFAELMCSAWGYVFYEGETKRREWSDLFHMINDAGHCENGLYALRALYGHAGVSIPELKTFRSIESRLTGHGEAHLFPQGVYLSNGPLGSTVPQAQGLALADKARGNDRVTVLAVSDGGLMEGEAREALASIPGLAARGRMNPFVMIISDNNTKLTGRIDKDAFSMAPSFAALKDLGWDVIHLEDGHDLTACLRAFDEAVARARKNPVQPVAIHARTKKGYGVKACVESASGGHGFPVKDAKDLRVFITEIFAGVPIPDALLPWLNELEAAGLKKAEAASFAAPSAPKEKIQAGVAKALLTCRAKGHPIVSITADLPGSTGVLDFQKKYPDLTVDVGVAESNMISVAAGFSKQGFIPVVDTFAQFGVTKGALPLTMAALSSAPVIAIFSHTGFQDAADGASHQALSYLAQVGSIPHTEVYALTCSQEAEALVSQAVERFAQMRARGETPPNFVFFLGREDFPPVIGEAPVHSLGRAQVVFDSSKRFQQSVAILAVGSLLGEGIAAAQELEKQNLGAIVVNPSCLNIPDIATLSRVITTCEGRVLTVEDHQITGGAAGFLLPPLMESGVQIKKLKSLGVRDQFGRSAYKASQLYQMHGMDRVAILQAATQLLAP